MNLDDYESVPAEVGLPAFVRICAANSISFSIAFDNGNRKTSQGTRLLDMGGWMITVGGAAYQPEDLEMTYPTLLHALRVGFRLLREYMGQSELLVPFNTKADPYEAILIEHELQAFLNLCAWNKAATILAADFWQERSWRVKVASKLTPFDDSDPTYPSLKQAVRIGIHQLIEYAGQRGFQLRAKPPETHPI
jgi:hypothetical protein